MAARQVSRLLPSDGVRAEEDILERRIEFERKMLYAEGQLDMLRKLIELRVRCPCCGATFRNGVMENGGSLLLLPRKKVRGEMK